ncbi:hypothetical protein [Maledivibacter halophilus]|uniref:Uncharacterized protein n=1 Tax=Maledivibacter halophilus TaxID=36842 RepID=A0A1T5K1R4_9FIRM|nr:hypothetical protein [Maledivibacter halophilus]SKC57563.1 hypothetical protein SAMN02194393_01548 [Maledivibacter halophilus]
MAEKYMFFDSIDGEDERFYTADEFAEYFRQLISNGIFNGGDNLRVTTTGTDMSINIKEGYAWIEGYLYKIESEDLKLTLDAADSVLNRIDRIVIRLDKSLDKRYVKAFILKGIPAESPVAPEITRNDNTYEISLAQVEIVTGKSFIEDYQIIDERLNHEVCGITTHLFEQVDTTQIFNEWINYLNVKKQEANLSFEQFVSKWIQWVGDKLSEPDGEFYTEWKKWFNEIQDTTNLITRTQFKEHEDDNSAHNNIVNAIIFG